MKSLRILVDMDGILVDLMSKWLRVYNEEWKDTLTEADIHDWHIHQFVKPDCGHAIYDIAGRPRFYNDLAPLPGALEGVQALVEQGHDVAICSAPLGGDSARAKIEWVAEHMGWARQRVILAHLKHWLAADVLIDDSPENIRHWCTTGRPVMAIATPWNESCRQLTACHAESYTDTVSAWGQIVEAVDRYAKEH